LGAIFGQYLLPHTLKVMQVCPTIAVVKAFYKEGNKASMTNYCPSLEKAMHSRLSQHLHTNDIMVTEQYSSKNGISTEDATSD
jgi:hypothetical protein